MPDVNKGEVSGIGLNRRKYREKKKLEKWKERLKYGMPDRRNEFDKTDLTPYNAAGVISGKISIDEIRYR